MSEDDVRHKIIQLRVRAATARELAQQLSDRQAAANLLSLAADLEREADSLDGKHAPKPGNHGPRNGRGPA